MHCTLEKKLNGQKEYTLKGLHFKVLLKLKRKIPLKLNLNRKITVQFQKHFMMQPHEAVFVAVSCGYSTCFAVRTCDGLCYLILHSEIDQIHLSIKAQCVTSLLPLGDCHSILPICSTFFLLEYGVTFFFQSVAMLAQEKCQFLIPANQIKFIPVAIYIQ